MRRLLAGSLALALIVAVAGCELLPRSPLAELEPPDALPEPTTTWLELGRRLLAADRPDQAHDAFLRSLRVEGVTAAALTGAGVAAERRGLLTDARRLFERARTQAPESVTAHNNLGAVLYRLGEMDAARRAFQAALALSDGTDEVAARNLGIIAAATRRAGPANTELADNPYRLQRLGPARFRLLVEAERRGNG